ncbi:MAG: alpha-L-arabinofuranosidase [Pseudonocardiales bacterium]|nr:alpha-L-arabinofuranosidase [Pseudonocardiales bacterium]
MGPRYVIFYVAHDDKSGKQCIGRAESASPTGPFADTASSPVVCQSDLGGSIDPDPVRGPNGELYLYWKNDGNCCGYPVRLWGQRMSADAAALVGKPVPLMSNTKSWQGNLVEAPEMVRHGDAYFLFYSANDYASEKYAVGYATCQAPLGPCTDSSDQPLLSSSAVAAGPGHCYILQLAGGRTVMFFHAWPPNAIGSQSPGRQLWWEQLDWKAGKPSMTPPQ